MKFYLDENVDPAVAASLRRRGIDAVATQEAGLKGADDDRQVELAVTESRVIVTHDADLLRIHRSGVPHPGIVFITSGRRPLGEIVRKLVLLHEAVPAETMQNRVEYV